MLTKLNNPESPMQNKDKHGTPTTTQSYIILASDNDNVELISLAQSKLQVTPIRKQRPIDCTGNAS
jgi:hypothetical protein